MFCQLLVNGLFQASALVLIGLGVSVLYSTQRFFNFVHGALFTIAAYTAYALSSQGVPLWISAVAGVVPAALIGTLLEGVVFHRLRSGGGSPAIQMLASLGAYVVLINIVSLTWGDDIRSLWTQDIREGYTIWQARVSGAQVTIAVGSALLVALTLTLLRWTRFGKMLRAAAEDPHLARCVGLDERRIILLGTVLGSTLAGASGVLMALDIGLTPTMGFRALLLGIVVCIVGGMGSILGVVVAGLLLGLAMNLGVLFMATYWQDAIAFGVMAVFLLIRPRGIFGTAIGRVDS